MKMAISEEQVVDFIWRTMLAITIFIWIATLSVVLVRMFSDKMPEFLIKWVNLVG